MAPLCASPSYCSEPVSFVVAFANAWPWTACELSLTELLVPRHGPPLKHNCSLWWARNQIYEGATVCETLASLQLKRILNVVQRRLVFLLGRLAIAHSCSFGRRKLCPRLCERLFSQTRLVRSLQHIFNTIEHSFNARQTTRETYICSTDSLARSMAIGCTFLHDFP